MTGISRLLGNSSRCSTTRRTSSSRSRTADGPVRHERMAAMPATAVKYWAATRVSRRTGTAGGYGGQGTAARPFCDTPRPMIRVRGLRKVYGDLVAVDGVDLDVAAGEVFALLGPNGAGKTTTVEVLEGYRSRTAGEVSVLGVDPERADASW